MRRVFISAALLAAAACAPAARSVPAPWSPDRGNPLALAVPFLDSMITEGAAPGAVLGVSIGGVHFFHATGQLGETDFAAPDSSTIYDMASLTKVLALTTLVAIAVDEGRIDLDAAVARYLPAFSSEGHGDVTIRHLLTHSSGLPAWRALFREAPTRDEAMMLADSTPLEQAPGKRFVYSDLGAIVLTQVVERVYGMRLDSLFATRIAGPLQLTDSRFLPPIDWWFRTAPTELDPWRGRVLRAEVHDENAGRLDGVSGHAGLFSSARDLVAMGDWLMQLWHGSPGEPGWRWPPPPAALRDFVTRQGMPRGSSRAMGWDTPSEGSSAGTHLSDHAFGHTGFTGTSIWIDPDRELVIVLLSNRVHPTRENSRWGAVRRGSADRIVQAMEGR